MSTENGHKSHLFAHNIQKFIHTFPDLKYDGSRVWCLICNRDLLCWKPAHCRKHLASANHKYKKSGRKPYTEFLLHFLFMLSSCNIPFYTIQKKPFRNFWQKHNPDWKLPAETTLRRYLPRLRERMENRIRHELDNKKLWLTIDESTDIQKNSVANVVVRTLNPHGPSISYLLASKRLQSCTGESIQNVVLSSLQKFKISTNQILMFVTDGGSPMLKAGRLLKHVCPNLLHVTCLLHALHLVAESICSCYPDVDALIAQTKAVFYKSPKRIRQFKIKCPNIPEPPQLVFTRWGTWLKTAFYYHLYFQQVRSLMLQFNATEAAAIQASQLIFQDPQIETDLQTIFNNYQIITNAITAFQKPSLSLKEALKIVDTLQTQLETLTDEKSVRVREKFKSVLQNNADLVRLRHISTNTNCDPTEPFACLKDHFNYANITSLDVEQSFSLYKNILSPQRSKLKEETVETHAMLQVFSRADLEL